jgi:glycerol kinase
MLAGLGCGLWPDRAALAANWREQRAFQPQLAADVVAAHRQRWALAVGKA